jgi:malonyl-CoA O-methyltransferase
MNPKLKTIQRNFARAAACYAEHAVLQAEVEQRTLERLDYFQLDPGVVLDLGCGPARALPTFRNRYPRARKLLLDLAEPMLSAVPRRTRFRRLPHHPIVADMHQLPLADASVDLIFSSLALQWAQDLDAVFKECRRVLRPNGLLLFATLGPQTLYELRRAADTAGMPVGINHFPDMHDVGDALVRAGLGDPVMDREELILEYRGVQDLLADLKRIGANTRLQASEDTPRSLRGRAWLEALNQTYATFAQGDVLPATYEVVYGQASCPPQGARPQDGSTVVGGEVHIPVERIRRGPRADTSGPDPYPPAGQNTNGTGHSTRPLASGGAD